MALQEEKESRRLWRKLTRALLYQPDMADEEKAAIENMARHRDSEEEYTPRFFEVPYFFTFEITHESGLSIIAAQVNLCEGEEGLNIGASFKYPLVSWYPDQDVV